MSQLVEILSDEEDQQLTFPFSPSPPPPTFTKRRKLDTSSSSFNNNIVILVDDDPTPIKKPLSSIAKCTSDKQLKRPYVDAYDSSFVVLNDDPTPKKPSPTSSTPSFVLDTPMSNYNIGVSRTAAVDAYDSSFVVLNDDPTPKKPSPTSSTPSFVLDTPMSSLPTFDFNQEKTAAGVSGLICLESDNESEDGGQRKFSKESENICSDFGFGSLSPGFGDDAVLSERFSENEISEVYGNNEEENVPTEQVGNAMKQAHNKLVEADEGKNIRKDEAMAKKTKRKEEKICLAEEKKLKREQEKLQKEALKAEAAEAKKLQKEQQKWEKGKFALKSIVAEIDTKVVELGSIGGHLLTRFADKGVSYRITSNPIERSIVWTLSVPDEVSELSSKQMEIAYVLLVYEADEFCNLVINESLMRHVSGVQSRYSSYTVCCLTNKLMSYINKREQGQYKNQGNANKWKRPPVEEVLSKLTTSFARVHSRQCRDEAELADHVVGLTCSLANCQFRKKLTRLSINANGANVPKDFIDRDLIKKNVWMKALVAIPKVQPRCAVAIWKKYPTMKSLLSAYMDTSKSVHEKEFLLKDIPTEGLLGNEDRRVGEICSKRIYRILMAQNGNIKTDDVELGADFFRS
ncbi:hypothetical protein IFM89_039353 [Coptis chinensis]|uniref:ERCC4 domain-containing protein n=1 Tax=Coptis chinensis TaxID=261450 RepID=A0A835LUP3_9MAGN|nr:hypothetical protein IFM89_039353 [Coptis chinensis]